MKKENTIGRKEFLASVFAASAGCAMDRNASARRFDDSLSVLLSDVHIGKPAPGCMHQIEFLNAVADEILSLDPPPKRVVGFGDLSILDGLECDYETSRRIFLPPPRRCGNRSLQRSRQPDGHCVKNRSNAH